ncbi:MULTISPECIES: heat shock protein transcriptional repressor HspR [unclassified Luteococcus]|uniref:heat shock protein transcriptional repressor HspR n=1 Tax=unclassified Luteococcus TaxID=2639923 RepID=UPI00313DB8FA
MSANYPQVVDRDAAVFTIGVAANLAGMHPQTLRQYDRLGLVVPRRSRGRGRRYSPRDVAKLRLVQHLSQDEGINLSGIQRILELENELDALRSRLTEAEALLAEARAARSVPGAGGRVFTAETSGAVHLGRHVTRRQLALPAR